MSRRKINEPMFHTQTAAEVPANGRRGRREILLGAALLAALGIWAAPRLHGFWLERLPTGQLTDYSAAHPDDRSTVELLVGRYLNEGRAADAEAAAARSLQRDPENPPLWLLRSRAELAQGKMGPAYASLQVALPYLQQSAEAHWVLGKLLARRGDDGGEQREWRQAEALDPNHPDLCLDLARTELAHFQYGPAAAHLQRVLQRRPADHEALILRAQVRRSTGDLAGAEQDARAVVHAAPGDAAAWQALGEVLQLRGTPDALREAEECFRSAMRNTSDPATVHQHLGQLLFGQGRYAEAAAELEQALRANDLNPIPYSTLMQCYARLGRTAEVPPLQQKYRKIEEIDLSTGPLEYTVAALPENTTARLKLARLYQKFGRPDLAMAQVDAALKVNPTLPEALRLKDEWNRARP